MKVWNIAKRVMKIILVLIGVIVLIGVVLLLILWLWSPGTVQPFQDEEGNPLEGSVADRVAVPIGGFDQGMIIRGKSDENPVLLFLHGGPGNPEYILAKNYDIGLEDYFTVCWWDQKGSGMSFSSSIEPETMTLENMIADTLEVTDYLRERFGVDKIYLMGHSWGSFLGMNAVAQYPDRYFAYMGIGQVVDQMESERMSYEAMVRYAKSTGDAKLEERLRQYTLNGAADVSTEYLMLRSDTLSKMGNGVFHEQQSKWNDMLLPMLQAREYTLSDKYGYAMGSLESLGYPINASQMNTSLFEEIPAVDIPVYLFHGEHDLQVSYDLSKEYYELLDAPAKGFYSFGASAHSPFMEEPECFMDIIVRDILRQPYGESHSKTDG